MVSTALIKLSSPLARSCLIAIGIALVIDAVLTLLAASRYPYLIAYIDQLYIQDSQSVRFVYSAVAIATLVISITTAVASFKSATNFVLVHAVLTGVFLPVSILVYFTSISLRYKVSEYAADYKQMIAEYRVANHGAVKSIERHLSINSSETGESTKQLRLASFINLIDTIQARFSCCGIESTQDWIKAWDGFIPPSCCTNAKGEQNPRWVALFNVEEKHEFAHCSETDAYHLGCFAALKEDEQSKFFLLTNLIVFLMLLTITNTIVSLLLFGLSKTENIPFDNNDHELTMVSMKPRPSQPEITAMRHRPSVVHTLGPNREQISAISHAVRFNLSNNSPRASVSGPSKFSAGARRGSAFV